MTISSASPDRRGSPEDYGPPAAYGSPYGLPADYGLPTESEIARIAKAYFPEFATAPADLVPNPPHAPDFSFTDPTDPATSATPRPDAYLSYAPALVSEAEADKLAASRATGPDIDGGVPLSDGAATRPDAALRRDTARMGDDHDAYERSKYIGKYPLAKIRDDFPILTERVNGGKALIWLDNAATTQRPRQVIDRISHYYEHENSNVHRGAHALAARSTDAYEDARGKVASFVGAPSPDDIVFVRGTTEGINLVANAFVKPLLSPGDEIVLTVLEHHANIVPWQIVAAETGAVLKVAPVDDDGQIIPGEYTRLFSPKTKVASVAHVSNALGTITPVAEIIATAHSFGVPVLVDGAQSAPHTPLDVTALDADFFVFSGHKIFGPTGIGAVYGKSEHLEAARPWQGGGNMIKDVTFERTVYHRAPQKFEAGTGSIADAVGLGAAIDYLEDIGIENIAAYEHELLEYAQAELCAIPGLRLIGTAPSKASVLSFVLDGHTVEEVGQLLSDEGIAVRAGHHCAQPAVRRFGLEGTVRPSIAFYNTPREIDTLAATIRRIAKG
jgi:cysteine desulfurase/selenocysteine lyase